MKYKIKFNAKRASWIPSCIAAVCIVLSLVLVPFSSCEKDNTETKQEESTDVSIVPPTDDADKVDENSNDTVQPNEDTAEDGAEVQVDTQTSVSANPPSTRPYESLSGKELYDELSQHKIVVGIKSMTEDSTVKFKQSSEEVFYITVDGYQYKSTDTGNDLEFLKKLTLKESTNCVIIDENNSIILKSPGKCAIKVYCGDHNRELATLSFTITE